MTTTDLTANDVVWDLNPLLPAPDDVGLDQLLADADATADELAAPRPDRRVSTPTAWSSSCTASPKSTT